MMRFRLCIGVVWVLLGGCGEPVGDGGYTGGGGSGNPYLGVWQFQSGNSFATCDNGTSPTEALAGSTLNIQSGGDNQLVVAQGGCSVRFSLSSGLAQLTRTQECSVSGSTQGGSYTGTLQFTDGSMQYFRSTDLRFTQTYRAQLRYSTGQTVTCDVTTNGSLAKL